MTEEKKTPSNPRGRVVAATITFVLLALAVQDQVTSGSIDAPLLGALIILGFGWAGWGTDRIADRVLGR